MTRSTVCVSCGVDANLDGYSRLMNAAGECGACAPTTPERYVPDCDYCGANAIARIPDDMTDDTADVCGDHLRGVSVDDIVAVFTGIIWTENLDYGFSRALRGGLKVRKGKVVFAPNR